MSELTDHSPMPWGKYKGEAMINVPASYLLWLWDNDKCSGNVKRYIMGDLEVLRKQAKEGQ